MLLIGANTEFTAKAVLAVINNKPVLKKVEEKGRVTKHLKKKVNT